MSFQRDLLLVAVGLLPYAVMIAAAVAVAWWLGWLVACFEAAMILRQ